MFDRALLYITRDRFVSIEALSGAGEASTEEAASSWSSAVSEDHTSPDSCATSNSRPGSTVDHRRDRHSRPPSYATAGAAAAAAVAAVTAAANSTDANPYACQYCDKTFPRGSYLKKHEQTWWGKPVPRGIEDGEEGKRAVYIADRGLRSAPASSDKV
ncbi:zinc finger protein 521-like [Aphis craccivora]|uniref:Zinc finger protein 521-like n=1 Tax=Aphis craccivora TaxID=307492 RepID=A0A6G0ZRW4_APHCR|nr:zinc finger protein 521-like [Aphis craccivora]